MGKKKLRNPYREGSRKHIVFEMLKNQKSYVPRKELISHSLRNPVKEVLLGDESILKKEKSILHSTIGRIKEKLPEGYEIKFHYRKDGYKLEEVK